MVKIAAWAALHREDGTELTEADAPGYCRAPYSDTIDANFGETTADWGWVFYGSAWDAETGGNRISALTPMQKEWVRGDV